MPLTSDILEELDRLLDIFFEKISRKERLGKQILKLMDECEAYLYPKIRECLQGAREQIIRDIKKKILKKRAEPGDSSAIASVIYISGRGPTEISKKSKPQIVVDYVDWELIERSEKSIIKPAYLNIMERSGNLAREHGKIEASFDVINPRSVTWAEKYSSELVTLVGKETKAGLRAIVTHGVKKGKTLTQIAREIEDMGIGLNERQTKALLKYGDLLEVQGIKGKLYQDKWKKYYDRLQRDRSQLIARTEVSRSINEGYLDSLEGTRYEEVEISSAADACDLCLDLAGIKFKGSEARGMLPVHPNCRCHWIIVIPRAKKPKVPEKPGIPKKPKLVPKTPKEIRAEIEKIHKDSIEELAGFDRQAYRYQKRSLEFKRLGLTDSAEKYKDLYLKSEAKADFARKLEATKMTKILQVTDKGFDLRPEWASAITEKDKVFLRKGLKEFSRLIDKKSAGALFPRMGKTNLRSYYSRGSIYIAQPRITYEDTRAIVHEMGHWLEDMNPNIHKAVMTFYKKRTKGEGLVRLLDGYGKDELTRRDKFIDVYMGKDYKGKASEILSMGLEEFYKNPYRLATKDPEYFDLIYNVVRGIY